jgi:hypothetical protein
MATPGKHDRKWPLVMDTGQGEKTTNKGINYSWTESQRNDVKYFLYVGEMKQETPIVLPEITVTETYNPPSREYRINVKPITVSKETLKDLQ